MRDDLSEILYDATRDDVEYVFGDSVTSISADGDVTFERGAPRRFDLVIGADGLHSNVRRLVFGPSRGSHRWLGAYLAVVSIPNYLRPATTACSAHSASAGWSASTAPGTWPTRGRCSCSAATRRSTTTTATSPRQKQLLRADRSPAWAAT